MALLFPGLDDTIKSRSYSEVNEDPLSQNYFSTLRNSYNQAKENFIINKKRTLEQKLSHLAEMWADAVNDKARERISNRALTLVKGCCSVRKSFTQETKEYYKTFRNLRRIYSGEKSFHIAYS
jgi:hypothetical protein